MKRWLVRATVSAIVVSVLLTMIPIGQVLDALGRVSVWAWAASVAIFFAGHYLNALKLRLLLDGGGLTPELRGLTPSIQACVKAQYAGLVANLGLPGLAGGDFVRAAYLAPAVGTKRVALASIADRLIDSLTLLALVAVSLPLAGMPAGIDGVVQNLGFWLGVGLAIAVLAALLLVKTRVFGRLSEAARDAAVEIGRRRGAVVAAIAISLGVQSAFVMTNVWLARQVGVTTGLAAWFVAWPLSKLIAVLPISLGGIGVREAALVSLLAPYGAAREAVLASGILWQAVLIVTGLAGLVVTQMVLRAPSRPRASTEKA